MKWLIDTNVVSEIRKGERCHNLVADWWSSLANEDMFLSALTVGEIRKGIEIVRPRDPAKAAEIEAWLVWLCTAFADRILPVDAAVAQAWGRLCALRPMPVVDTHRGCARPGPGHAQRCRCRRLRGPAVRSVQPAALAFLT